MAKRKKSDLVEEIVAKSYRCKRCGGITDDRESIKVCPECGEAVCGNCGKVFSIMAGDTLDGDEKGVAVTAEILAHDECHPGLIKRLKDVLTLPRILGSLTRQLNKDRPIDPDKVQTGPDKPKGKKGEKPA
jgi:ribosomal protein L37AE/L43A